MRFNTSFLELSLGRHPYRIIVKFHGNSGWYRKDYREFKKKLGAAENEFPVSDNYPCLFDKTGNAGDIHNHYFIQDLYVAQKVFQNNPEKHVDMGSRIDGFVAHVASFRDIELLDIRKMESTIPHVKFTQVDLMDESKVPENYCDSISSLHALEHFGLGRYGEPIDPDGHLKGLKNVTKMLKPHGIFYFSVPMGRQRIEFNAHRVFGMPYLINLVLTDYDIISFSYIDDQGQLHQNISMSNKGITTSFGCNFGCAIFELRKK